MEKDVKTKKLQTNIPEPLFDRIKARAERLWGENDSESNVVATALRDWLSQSERGCLDARLDQMERRIEHLLTTRPVEGFWDDRPTLDDPQVRRRLALGEGTPVVTTAGVNLPHFPMRPSATKIGEVVGSLFREHRGEGRGFDVIKFEYLLGYEPEGQINFSDYEDAGFPLLRDRKNYNSNNETMRQLLDRYWANRKFSCAPLLTYYTGGKLVILDGLARFTALMEVWRQGRGTPTKLPIELFYGDFDEARKEMILRNLHGGPRSLTRAEFERAVDRLNGLV